jgi:hypothetical protein
VRDMSATGGPPEPFTPHRSGTAGTA